VYDDHDDHDDDEGDRQTGRQASALDGPRLLSPLLPPACHKPHQS